VRIDGPLLIVAGFVFLAAVGPMFSFKDHQPVSVGDPQAAFGGALFLYVGAVLALASRRPQGNWLFEFLNRRRNAGVLGIVFLVIGFLMLAIGALGFWPDA
jgi:hypothetical protein